MAGTDMELTSTAPLSEGTTSISSWTDGFLEGEIPALFVTSFFGKDGLITDVFYLEEGHGLKNIAMDPETRRSKNVFHYYAGVQPEDIDGDGCMDVPVAQSVPAYGESSADRFWWLQWMHYRVDGSRDLVMTTYTAGMAGTWKSRRTGPGNSRCAGRRAPPLGCVR